MRPASGRNPCPALLNPKDWCHEDIPWEAPPLIRALDKLTGLRKDALKFSYLVLRRDEELAVRRVRRGSLPRGERTARLERGEGQSTTSAAPQDES